MSKYVIKGDVPLETMRNLCKVLHEAEMNPAIARPEVVADAFRSFFRVGCPFNKPEAEKLVDELQVAVFLQRDFERRTHLRGIWVHAGELPPQVTIDDSKPLSRILFTLLHEVGEQLVFQSLAFWGQHWKMPNTKREKWANAFSAYVKMPKSLFVEKYNEFGFDVRLLADYFDGSAAQVLRHTRDVIFPHSEFYGARVSVEFSPEERCPGLLGLLNQSDGVCVRVRDIVRGNIPINRISGGLPMFNLPKSNQWRVVHPIFNRMISQNTPVFIRNISGISSYEFLDSYEDLFSLNRLSMLILPYGRSRVKGFIIQAVRPEHDLCFAQVIERLGIEEVSGVEWIFSTGYFEKPKEKKREIQKEINFNTDGSPMDFKFLGKKYSLFDAY